MFTVADLWRSFDPDEWAAALERYWQTVQSANLDLEQSLDSLDLDRIRGLDPQGWYSFLRDEYFRWKFTQANYYAANVGHLRRYESTGTLEELHRIKQELLGLDQASVSDGLRTATQISGLGIAGASGLLALMYPASFATVDQFVVKALRDVGDLPEADALARMKPKGLTIQDGVTLIGIMTRKAAENNKRFGKAAWTPRKIDQILWSYGR